MSKIKRSQFLTYVNTTPSTTATYVLMGAGVVNGTINMNPKTTEETYIHEDTATITVESYAPTMPVEITANNGEALFEYLDNLFRTRAVLGDCETDIINVWNYETGGPSAAPAQKQPVSIQVDSFGGDGGAAVKLSVTLNYQGNPTTGTFNTSTKAFS